MFNLKSEINKSMQWKKLEKLAKKMRKIEMRDMFEKDNKRAEKYTLELEICWLIFLKTALMIKCLRHCSD